MTKAIIPGLLSIDRLFQQVTQRLKKEKITFAVAGGIAVSLYRLRKRSTDDLDFLIFSEDHIEERGESIVRSFGLTPAIVRKADLEGGPLFAIKRRSTPPYMIIGRSRDHKEAVGLDFILPSMPWFANALARAQDNPIDYGYGETPTLTVEDVLLSKFFSFQNDGQRFKDLDDIQSIFQSGHDLDLAYLSGQMGKLHVTLPKALQDLAPAVLNQVSRAIHIAQKRVSKRG